MALPSDLSGLQVWYKASTLALSSGNPVSSWLDSSGNGRTIQQSNASLQPIFQTGLSGISVGKAVRFDGTDDFMQTVAGVNWSTIFGALNYTLFALVNFRTASGTGEVFTDGNGVIGMRSVVSSGVLQAFQSPDLVNTGTLVVGAWEKCLVMRRNVSAGIFVGVDNFADAGLNSTGSTGNPATARIRLGQVSASDQFDVVEAFGFNRALTEAERLQMSDYLDTLISSSGSGTGIVLVL